MGYSNDDNVIIKVEGTLRNPLGDMAVINVNAGTAVDFNFTEKTITFPANTIIRWKNQSHTIVAETNLDLTVGGKTANRNFVFFNTITKVLKMYTSTSTPQISEVTENEILVAVSSIIAKTVNIQCENYTIDNKNPYVGLVPPLGELGIVNTSAGVPVEFDFNAKTVTFPTNTIIRWRNLSYTFTSSQVLGLTISGQTGNRGLIYFDTVGKVFKLYQPSASNYPSYIGKVTDNEVLICVYSISGRTVVTLCENYTIDGKSPFYTSEDLKGKELDMFVDKYVADPDPFDFSIALITDSHSIDSTAIANNNYLHLGEVANLTKRIKMDVIIHGGDITYDYVNKLDLVTNLKKNIEEFKTSVNTPVLITQGNHDTGDKYAFDLAKPAPSSVISPVEWGKLMTFDNDCNFGDGSKSYYFKDFEKQKIRVVVLNSMDAWVIDTDGKVKYNRGENAVHGNRVHAYRQDQILWFATKALDFTGKQGYGLIVVSHVGLIPALEGIVHPHNSEVVYEILKARKNKTAHNPTVTTGDFGINIGVDYTTANDIDVICTICGHIHRDELIAHEGITNICVTQSRNPDDTTDSAWDVFGINREKRLVKIKRFGKRGADRQFNY